MDVCLLWVLSGRGLCDGLITRPEESYRVWRVFVWDQETSNEEAKARYGVVKNTTQRVVTPRKQNPLTTRRTREQMTLGPSGMWSRCSAFVTHSVSTSLFHAPLFCFLHLCGGDRKDHVKWPSYFARLDGVTFFNHLTPNDHFSGRTAPLTSRCCIFYLFNKYTYWIF
jgi:hypothetical protein